MLHDMKILGSTSLYACLSWGGLPKLLRGVTVRGGSKSSITCMTPPGSEACSMCCTIKLGHSCHILPF